ncbi:MULTISPECIES: family 16 glycosylhydrolase [unclassified Wenzhouxiangella]|uniref:glycoside hydrolase family 16 protein n=1 Tax=unclassified Wenzhouxiangella TaxID=2613841 RepID=UPI000E327741|nr:MULTISPECIES: glycoside hydrolase family 16 protein [unclassified Wenzhouxiangella]RFF28847.1 glycoside hydrolase family 16 protein [Wenzhouxiangella sp. 15181]RFP68176.1 glycoside hydrolase family 16 protein [Wenzhouxiangella sp. 15190]
MVRILLIGVGLSLAASASAGWQLEWIDRFDGEGVNWDNWTAQTAANYNNEVQCYTDDDSSVDRNYDVSGGTLKIIARRQDINCPGQNGTPKSWTSGRINSKDKREFLYGRIEARIRFHDLQGGTWPAFWMLENRIDEQPVKGDNDNVGWPNPGASEIDVWEWFSNEPGSYIVNFFNNYGGACGSEARFPYPGGAADVTEWHTYAMEWSADEIAFFMDGEQMRSYDVSDCPVYEEPMFVLLNVAIGGNLGGAIDPDLEQATMEVDYVAHCKESPDSDASACDEQTPQAFDFALDADGQWVADEEALIGHGQGLTFDHMPFADLLFVAWFTYIDAAATDSSEGIDRIGAVDNRWLTASLDVDGDIASGPLYASTGGHFDAPAQPGQESVEVGSMTIEFSDCDRGVVQYTIDDPELAGEFPIIPLEKRVNGDFRCRSETAPSQ